MKIEYEEIKYGSGQVAYTRFFYKNPNGYKTTHGRTETIGTNGNVAYRGCMKLGQRIGLAFVCVSVIEFL